jgi:hypothetical protein
MSLEMPQGHGSDPREVSLPRFRRVFTLSKELDTEKLSGRAEAGVLKLRIQKAEHAKPRRIEVQRARAAGTLARIRAQSRSFHEERW